MSVVTVSTPSFLEKLTNAIHLDYVLKIAGCGGFVCAFLASWHTLGLGVKSGMLGVRCRLDCGQPILEDISLSGIQPILSAVCAPATVSPSPAKYRLFGGAAGPGKTKALLWEAILQAQPVGRSRHAAAAAHVSGTGILAARVLSARRARALVQEIQRVQARRHLAQRLDDALRLLPQRKRRLPISGRGVSLHRSRRADALHAEAMAISDLPQSLPRARQHLRHGRRDEPGQHRPRLGESAVGRSQTAGGI